MRMDVIKVPKWIGVSGSWRTTSPEVERDVRKCSKEIALAGNGLVTGGALNVDYQATDEVLQLKRPRQIKVFLPTSYTTYVAHYRKRAREGVVTPQQAENLISQLAILKEQNPEGLMENLKNTGVNEQTYYERNTAVVNASDELIAFQVNNSAGTQDAINKARTKGIPVKVYSYEITEDQEAKK